MTERYGLEEFVTDVRNVMSRQPSDAETLTALSPRFKQLLANRSFLREKLAEMGTTADEVYLYRDPDYHFTVLARGVSQKKAQKGDSHAGVPHDHGPLWALYGIYEGSAQFQRYEPDPASTSGPFPGLRLIADVPAKAGEFDAVMPHSMHLPVFPPEGSAIVVVYKNFLEAVSRRGYVAAINGVVDFQGVFAPLTAPPETGARA